ncbi:hypothetical protein ACRALDRAFT_2060711 [Sodiomyces alcalophilus JCM 7366]|uniref:uncharacterized protein n=1 Tax=Sodiomyces alcalophilus JCM 7366 TaxID=591952 RepID=UPI0039B637FC
MPWRKPWIDPSEPPWPSDPSALRSALERRAYEVWISEIMLQQTRVAVVIDYWNRWMARWPTIHHLARATPDDVLSAWRGLGYYSRATRIHDAATLVVADPAMRGLLPREVAELEKKVPGVGRYTAGAIAAIVFGLPAPMVDGNVLRVLSRQLGLFANVKTDKSAVDLLWAAADALVRAVATDGQPPHDSSPMTTDEETPVPNDRPGRWGQALMELGSTVCTPKPNCAQCPITSTCRAYAEGQALASKTKAKSNSGQSLDIEDVICTLCQPFEAASVEDVTGDAEVVVETKGGSKKTKSAKQVTLSVFFEHKHTLTTTGKMEAIVDHCRKFPVKGVKKAVREQETLVCAIRRDDGSYLISRRPDKGLLAGLWEFPSRILVDGDEEASSKAARSKLAISHVTEMLGRKQRDGLTGGQGVFTDLKGLNYEGELGSVPWLFSHLKLTMHVHVFVLDGGWSDAGALSTPPAMQRWASRDEVDCESMGTGMRRCWALVQDWEREISEATDGQ